jgi:hypothetical protein
MPNVYKKCKDLIGSECLYIIKMQGNSMQIWQLIKKHKVAIPANYPEKVRSKLHNIKNK